MNASPQNRRASARRWLAALACAAIACGTTSHAFAGSSSDDDEPTPDARLTGYDPAVPAIGGGVALSYALVAFLGVISVGITFKNARRSHLD